MNIGAVNILPAAAVAAVVRPRLAGVVMPPYLAGVGSAAAGTDAVRRRNPEVL